MTGVVTNLNRKKGYGFIKDSEGHSRFFHARDLVNIDFAELQDPAPEGNPVEFEPLSGGAGGNGLRAEGVRVTD